MDFNLFIVPLTMIFTQLVKSTPLNSTWLPHVAVLIGGVLGAVYALYYGGDVLVNVVEGITYGAAASGIYDVAKSSKEVI